MEPVEYMPPGRLSGHRHREKLIQVQTEFAQRPRPRITSTVTVDGRAVHKTDRECGDDLSREENRLKLEIDLAEQHRTVMALVVERAAEFADSGKANPTPAADGYEPPSFRDTIEEILRTVPYTMAFYEFDQEGQIIHRAQFRGMVADWDREFAALSAIVFGLPQVIRVGEFRQGIVQFGAENVIAAQIRGRAFGIITEPAATVEHLRRDFPEFFEAVYHASDPV